MLLTVIIFLAVLAVLIFVHELGHFLAARASGIRVDAFALGFGPKIFSWKRGETTYSLNIIPFGGYVKIHGENPDEESVSGPDASRSFVNKPRWKQIMVLAAGVTFNFIFAWFLYVGGFLTGVTASSEGFPKYADQITNERIMLTFVSPDSPAQGAGLKAGDVLIGVDHTNTPAVPAPAENVAEVAIPMTIEEIQAAISASKGNPVELIVQDPETDSGTRIVEVVPVEGLVEDTFAVGIAMQNVGDLRLPFFTAIWEGLRYTGIMIRDTTIGLATFLATVFQGTAKFADVAGPVGIAGIVGDAAHLGFNYLLMITALISINLGVINLVPFPALDGGRILFVLIEGTIRRRISMKFTNIVNFVGFAFLMLLMLVITFKDVAKLIK